MISQKMQKLVAGSSAIRAMFTEGNRLRELYGKKNVFDFSLGNPNVAVPNQVNEAIVEILDSEDSLALHGYNKSNAGHADVRQAIAENLNERFKTDFSEQNIVMTVGAAGGLNVILKTLLDPGDEVIVFVPFFGEYRNYVANYDGILVEVSPHISDFQPDLLAFAKRISKRTKAVIINTPNNPTGVVYSRETIKKIAEILVEKEQAFDTDIYLISDEPYRELVYDGVTVPFLPHYYQNTLVVYSYSKSLSLPGERIGYLVIPNGCKDSAAIFAGAEVATRILGFVNAPSLQQKIIKKCLHASIDVAYYNRNRETLYHGLKDLGFVCIKPQGAFYLFVKAPIEDDVAFCKMAKRFHILIVPGSAFACPGYFRVAYCVAYETIVNALPVFAKLVNVEEKI
ncbi:MAG: pyridoxal phosphate-dependent aminotransferase [Lachnospiraceae bacterium]|nr:pyridoxal phosphate-dependent aminotransferase [Lachnospiraceae bacterium]